MTVPAETVPRVEVTVLGDDYREETVRYDGANTVGIDDSNNLHILDGERQIGGHAAGHWAYYLVVTE